jgi:hypothetical protein
MSKKRVLFVSEASYLNTGYATFMGVLKIKEGQAFRGKTIQICQILKMRNKIRYMVQTQ